MPRLYRIRIAWEPVVVDRRVPGHTEIRPVRFSDLAEVPLGSLGRPVDDIYARGHKVPGCSAQIFHPWHGDIDAGYIPDGYYSLRS